MILIKSRILAGFFSNLNAAITWYWYSMRTDIPIYVQWDGIDGENAIELFFTQKYRYSSSPDYEHNANFQHSSLFTDQMKIALKEDVGNYLFDKYGGWFFCQGNIYIEQEFYKLRNLYNYIYTENLKLHDKYITPSHSLTNTLGINYRFIHFYFTDDGKRTPFSKIMSYEEYNKKYLTQIESTFEDGRFEKIYLASSQEPFFNLCLEKFKDKLLYIPMRRLTANEEEYTRGCSLFEEYSNVLKDVINLTNCSKLLISPSNLILGALYINPHIKYEVFDFLKHTITA